MREYRLHSTFTSVLLTWGIPVLMLLLVPFLLLLAWNTREEDGFFFGVLAWAALPVGLLLRELRIPRRIELHEHGLIVFRAPLRRLEIRATQISSIKPGGGNIGYLVVEHSGGKIQLLNQFDGFHDFLTRLKQSNPTIELRGC